MEELATTTTPSRDRTRETTPDAMAASTASPVETTNGDPVETATPLPARTGELARLDDPDLPVPVAAPSPVLVDHPGGAAPATTSPAELARLAAELEESERVLMTQRALMAEEARRQESLGAYEAAVTQILTALERDASVLTNLRELKLTRDADLDQRQRARFRELVEPVVARDATIQGDYRDVAVVYDMAYDQTIGIYPLGRLWRDDRVTEIMVNGPDQIFAEVEGRLVDTHLRYSSPEAARRVARNLAMTASSRAVSAQDPLVTASIPGARINVALSPVARSGVVITIRKAQPLLDAQALLDRHSLTPEILDFLADAVRSRANIVVSGSTNAGKTTVVNVLSSFIGADERVLVLEDVHELALQNHHVVALETKERASGDDTVAVGLADLMNNALRMRPDRIIVGEVREGQAAITLLKAANTGHDGAMTTVHGDSPELTLNDRLVTEIVAAQPMPDRAVRRMVASAFSIVVQVRNARGRRFISDVAVIDPGYIVDDVIAPHRVFAGRLGTDGLPVFSRVGGVEPATALARRFDDAGIDWSRWREGGLS